MDNESIKKIKIGNKFPFVILNTTKGTVTLPDDYNGKWFIFFSHPKDFTRVCTTEYVAFGKKYNKFKELNCELIGMSLNSLKTHNEWFEELENKFDVIIDYPVASDEKSELSTKLGILYEKNKSVTIRSLFLVDDKRVIRAVLNYPPEIMRSPEEVLRIIKELQEYDGKLESEI